MLILLIYNYSFQILIFLLFMLGWCLTGYELVCLVYVTEIGAQRLRKLGLTVLMLGWALGQIVFPFFILYLSWQQAFGVLGISLLVLGVWRLDESPRFLVSQQRYEEARAVLRKIAIYNHRVSFDFKLHQEIKVENQAHKHHYQYKKKKLKT